MKKLNLWGILIAAMFSVSILSCNKDLQDTQTSNTNNALGMTALTSPISPSSNCGPYVVTLENITQTGGEWTWTWSIYNPNPGNGLNGTTQDLSHFGFTLGDCIQLENVVSASYQDPKDPNNWIATNLQLKVDPSMANTCQAPYNSVVSMKFDVGTKSTTKQYFKVTINKNVDVDMNGVLYYKSGKNTTCGQVCFPGFGCEVTTEDCSMSQGFWFAKPNNTWPYDVVIGGHTYTQNEGKDIWNTSNAGGLSDAKKAFLQVAAIKLSAGTISQTSTVWTYVDIIENWLSTLPKLSADGANGTLAVQPKSNLTTNSTAGNAAGVIGDWINENHCDDDDYNDDGGNNNEPK